MAQATTSTGAESIRRDLTDLFASPTDPAVEALMARTLEMAKVFEAKYRGKVANLPPVEFAAMMAQLEADEEQAVKPEIFAYLLHSQNTQDPPAGRLLARPREAGAERRSHLEFFPLDLAAVTDEHAPAPFADPGAAQHPHHVD